MSTKFYLNRTSGSVGSNTTIDYMPITWYGGWSIVATTGIITYNMDPDSFEDLPFPINKVFQPFSASPQTTTLSRGVSRPLLPQTISGTIDYIIGLRDRGTDPSIIIYPRIHIVVVNTTTNTLFATLLNGYVDTIAFPKVSVITGVGLSSPQTLTSCTIPSDGNVYRLIIELGSKTTLTFSQWHETEVGVGTRKPPNQSFAKYPDLTVGASAFSGAGYYLFSGDVGLVAHPRPNINIENAVDLGSSLPINFSVDPLCKKRIWYKFTNPSDAVLSSQLCNIAPRDAFVEITSGNESPLTYYDWTRVKNPIMSPVRAATIVYYQISAIDYLPGDTVTLNVVASPSGPVQVGDLLILSDESAPNYFDPTFAGAGPATWFNPADGSVRLCSGKFIATELCVSLASGKWAGADQSNDMLIIYDKAPALTELHRVNMESDADSLGTDFKSFYYLMGGLPTSGQSLVRKISENGVIDTTTWTLPTANIGYIGGGGGNGSVGISRDSTILYYADDGMDRVRRHSLLTNTELLPVLPIPTGTVLIPGEVIVLQNNTIVVGYVGGSIDRVVHYDPDGTIKNVIETSVPLRLHHIVHSSANDIDRVWVWFHDNTSYGDQSYYKIRLINLITGATITEWQIPEFTGLAGQPPVPGSCTPPARFGAPGSCPLMIMMHPFDPDTGLPIDPEPPIEPPVLAPGGIYFINPDKAGVGTVPNRMGKHDSYYHDVEKKIPNPTIRLAYFGE